MQSGGKPALLKVYKPNSDETRGADILRHWGGRAVRVYAADEAAMVIERIVPALPLSALAADDDDRATHIWCDVVHRLHTKPAPDGWPDVVRRGRSFNNPPSHPR